MILLLIGGSTKESHEHKVVVSILLSNFLYLFYSMNSVLSYILNKILAFIVSMFKILHFRSLIFSCKILSFQNFDITVSAFWN